MVDSWAGRRNGASRYKDIFKSSRGWPQDGSAGRATRPIGRRYGRDFADRSGAAWLNRRPERQSDADAVLKSSRSSAIRVGSDWSMIARTRRVAETMSRL